MKKKDVLFIIVTIILLSLLSRKPKETVTHKIITQTETIIDTIRDTVPVPVLIHPERVDTVKISIRTDELIKSITDSLNRVSDTTKLNIPIPIERKEYKTEHYFAIVEGYKPNLLCLDLYNKTQIVTKTDITTIKKQPRFSLGVQTGYGYNGKNFTPYVGIGIQYNLFSW